MEPLNPADERLLADLKEALRTAQHPQAELIVANAQDAFGYASLDDELARLVYDSTKEPDLVDSVRAAQSSRMVIFECQAMTLELEDTRPKHHRPDRAAGTSDRDRREL